MKSADKNTVRAEYLAGGISLNDLADKYGLKRATVKSWALREKWNEQRQKVASKAASKRIQKIADAVADADAQDAVDVNRVKQKYMQIAEGLADAYLDMARKGKPFAVSAYKDAVSSFVRLSTMSPTGTTEGDENGTLAAALTEAAKSAEVWNGEAQDVPV